MERASSRQGLLRHAASPYASDSSTSSPRRETLAGAVEEEAVETMHGRRLSTAEEGGQKAHAGAGALGLRRALFASGTAEIEEAPGSAAAAQLGHELASPCASASPRRETLAAGKEEGAETMDDGGGGGGRLSAAEKGKQKADADLPSDVAGVLRRPAPCPGPVTEIEEAPPLPPGLLAASQLHRNQAKLDRMLAELQRLRGELGELSSSKRLQGEPRPGDDARRHAGAVVRHPLGPGAASEIEEAPPLPPGILAASQLHRNQAKQLDRLLAELQRLRGGLGELSSAKCLQGEPRPGDDAMRHAGAVVRHPLGPGAATEIEEAPPSPPPLPPGILAASQQHRNQAKQLDRLLAELQRLRGGLGGLSSSKRLQGEPRPGDDAMRHAGAVVRHPLGPGAASEIEEVPPSPPPLRSRLLALNAARGLGAAARTGPAGLGGMVDELRRKEATLALLESRLQQLRRERGEGASRCPGSEERAVAAEVQTLEHEMGTMHESLYISRDRMLALRLQEEEVQAYRESLEALEEFYKLVPVPQRKNTKISGICNWKLLVPVMAFANGLVLLVQFRALNPVHHLTHFVGAIAACWMLGSIAFCCRLLGTSSRSTKGFRLHFGRLICACFLLLVLFVFYLILWLIGGTLAGASQSLLAPAQAFSGLIGKHP